MSDIPAGIGHNHPPEPTLFEAARDRIENLYEEAKLWMDGAPITSQEMADDLANLKRLIQQAHEDADAARKIENKPFDDGKAEVQARYAPLIADTKSIKGKTVLALEAIDKSLTVWLNKVNAQLEAERRQAREEADRLAREAQEALRASQPDNLAEREEAERLLSEANRANAAAKRAEAKKPKAGGALGRAAHLRTHYVATLIPATAGQPDGMRVAMLHFMRTRPDRFRALVQDLADEHVRYGEHTEDEIPGFKITKTLSI
jgi:hypothetical protein